LALGNAELALKEAENSADSIRRQLGIASQSLSVPDNKLRLVTKEGEPVSELDARIGALERKLDELRLSYTEQHPDIVALLPMIAQLKDLFCKVHAFDRRLRVVIAYNDRTARKKERRFHKDVGQALAALNQVRWAKVKDPEAKIRELVSPKLPAYLFATQGSGPHLKVGLDQKAVTTYKKRFGKILIFTDRIDLSTLEVAQAYTDRNEVEQLFGEMNDPFNVPFRPVRHWTDQKIAVHAFICILGLLLLKLLQLKLKEQGITLSLEIIKDELSSVELGLWVTRSGKLFKIVSDLSKLQEKLFRILSLQNIASQLGVHQDSS